VVAVVVAAAAPCPLALLGNVGPTAVPLLAVLENMEAAVEVLALLEEAVAHVQAIAILQAVADLQSLPTPAGTQNPNHLSRTSP
jgi:hypothetical protein